jgi:plasmid stabilization system protein ParE
MPRPVSVSPRARLQQRLAVEYLLSRHRRAAERLAERFAKAYRQLADFPLSGARGSRPGLRRPVVAPYVITYRDGPTGVEILDIRHGRQRETPLPGDT